MNFTEAMIAVRDGSMVARGDWDDREAHVTLVKDQLQIVKTADKYRPWLISVDDMEANDWEIVVKQ